MGYDCNCNCSSGYTRPRNYLTKEERIELLKEYQDSLEKEAQGVRERIKTLEKAS